MKRLIADYRNLPARHCGSGAMRNLLYHYCGLDLDEAVAFGLGAGVECMYIACDRFEPSVMVFGRTATLEVDCAASLGVDYREIPEPDDAHAWEAVKDEVAEGNPVMLTGDIFYLDYRDYKVRFPAHRFVLVGFDDESKTAYIADHINADPEACSYGAIATSRNPPTGLSTMNLWGKFHGTKAKRSLEAACGIALKKAADQMTGRDTTQARLLSALAGEAPMDLAFGLVGLARFADEVAAWREREDAPFLASYTSKVIEKFGNGGGNFRKMYAEFLAWAQGVRPDLVSERVRVLAGRSAGGWTALSIILADASKNPDDKAVWSRAADQAAGILAIETELFETLADTTTG